MVQEPVDLLPSFGPGMLVLADRNFLSHRLARDTLATGTHLLWRASASFALAPITVSADGAYLAELNPACRGYGPPITVRVIEYIVRTTPAGGGEASCSDWTPSTRHHPFRGRCHVPPPARG